jgi:hypothetical protein
MVRPQPTTGLLWVFNGWCTYEWMSHGSSTIHRWVITGSPWMVHVGGGWIWFIHNWVINHNSFSMDGELVGSYKLLYSNSKHQTQECQLPNRLIRTCSKIAKGEKVEVVWENTSLKREALNLLNLVNVCSKWAWKKLPYFDSLINKYWLLNSYPKSALSNLLCISIIHHHPFFIWQQQQHHLNPLTHDAPTFLSY